jgi:hypothetical protein
VGGGKKEFLVPEKIELAVIMGYKFTGPSGLPNKFHGFVEVELEGRDRYVVEVESIESPVQLVEMNETRKSRKTWIVNKHIDLETYYMYIRQIDNASRLKVVCDWNLEERDN